MAASELDPPLLALKIEGAKNTGIFQKLEKARKEIFL